MKIKNYIKSVQINTCPICNSNHYIVITQLKDYELNTCSNSWRVNQCNNCSVWWLNPRPDLSELDIIYPSTYYAYNFKKKIGRLIYSAKILLDRIKLNKIFEHHPHKVKKYLDIGCGDGRYLKLAEKNKLIKKNIFGLEINQAQTKFLSDLGYNIKIGSVENIDKIINNKKFDLVTMFHVIEHISNVKETLLKLKFILNNDGLLVFETPNYDSLDCKLFKHHYWGGYHCPRHWTIFDPISIERTLKSAGYEIIKIEYKTGHSFWLYSIHHFLKYKLDFPRAAKLFDPLNSKMFLIIFTIFDILRIKLNFKTSSMLVYSRIKNN